VSTEDQAREGYSLTVQKDYLLDFAKKQGWQIYFPNSPNKIYEDEGYSGCSLERPALKQLLDDARAGKFNLVLVYKLDRFSRKLRDFLNILHDLDNVGVEVKSATEPYDSTTSSGKLMLQQLGCFAEFERNRIVERIFPGMVRGVRDGHWQGARYTPFGYIHNKVTRHLEVNPKEAETVKKIFNMYILGKSTVAIAKELFHAGVRSRNGNRFYPKLIYDILNNKVYLGTLIWNRRHYSKRLKTRSGKGYRYIANAPSDIIEALKAHEAIITQKEYELVQARLARNRTASSTRFRNNDYHLSGVLFCKKCGLPYRGCRLSRNSKTKEKRAWYRCASMNFLDRKCMNKAVIANAIEQLILDIIEAMVHVVTDPEKADSFPALIKELYSKFYRDDQSQNVLSEIPDNSVSKNATLKMLEILNGPEHTLRTQAFLIRMRNCSELKFGDQDIKEFVQMIFKRVDVEDQRIVGFDLYQPWKHCYDVGGKLCQNALKIKKMEEKRRTESSAVSWSRLADLWTWVRMTVIPKIELAYAIENKLFTENKRPAIPPV